MAAHSRILAWRIPGMGEPGEGKNLLLREKAINRVIPIDNANVEFVKTRSTVGGNVN